MKLNEEEVKKISENLFCPEGDLGIEVGNKMNLSNKELMDESVHLLHPEDGDRVIEVGIGNGRLSFPILDRIGQKGSFLGVDVSQTMIDEASKNIREYWSGNLKLVKGEIDQVTPQVTYDKLIAVNVVYFISDLEHFLSAIKKVVSKGGLVVLGMRTYKTLLKLPISKFNFHLRSEDEIKNVIEKSDFSELHQYTFTEKSTVKRQVDTDIEFENIIFSFRV